MTDFLKKVEGIHPRGKKRDTSLIKEKKGFSEPVGKTVKDHVDFLASAVQDLIKDFDFEDHVNQNFQQLRTFHSLVTKHRNQQALLQGLLDFCAGLDRAKGDLQKLYREGRLDKGISREQLHKFLDVTAVVLAKRNEFRDALTKLKAIDKQLITLGFRDED